MQKMPKVLLVEDNEMNRDMLSRRLRRKGYEVVLAGDGAEGLAAVVLREAGRRPDGHEPAGPGRVGGDAAAQGGAGDASRPGDRAHRARDGGRPEESCQAGCDDYETKPIELPALLEKIERLLAHGSSRLVFHDLRP